MGTVVGIYLQCPLMQCETVVRCGLCSAAIGPACDCVFGRLSSYKSVTTRISGEVDSLHSVDVYTCSSNGKEALLAQAKRSTSEQRSLHTPDRISC